WAGVLLVVNLNGKRERVWEEGEKSNPKDPTGSDMSSDGSREGLSLCWKKKCVVSLRSFSKNHIDVMVDDNMKESYGEVVRRIWLDTEANILTSIALAGQGLVNKGLFSLLRLAIRDGLVMGLRRPDQKSLSKRGILWCLWEVFCDLKEIREMGFRDLAKFNIAYDPSSLVARGTDHLFFGGASGLPKDFFPKGCSWLVGNGNLISIWDMPWLSSDHPCMVESFGNEPWTGCGGVSRVVGNILCAMGIDFFFRASLDPWRIRTLMWTLLLGPHVEPFVRVNFDALYYKDLGATYARVVIRNSYDLLIGVACFWNEFTQSPLIAKAWAALQALCFALDLDFRSVEMERDFLVAISKFQSTSIDRLTISMHIWGIKQSCSPDGKIRLASAMCILPLLASNFDAGASTRSTDVMDSGKDRARERMVRSVGCSLIAFFRSAPMMHWWVSIWSMTHNINDRLGLPEQWVSPIPLPLRD
ncbi:hypothetical protein Gorai_018514, partial [Gossypium raimondii]|nr:hypothetical protein [Gossypium raimondii]